jgi:hypothetical protein
MPHKKIINLFNKISFLLLIYFLLRIFLNHSLYIFVWQNTESNFFFKKNN